MYAVINGIHYKGARGGLATETLGAPVDALGEHSPIFFADDQPDLAKGSHLSLYNNAWGTNYIHLFGENTLYRFKLRVCSFVRRDRPHRTSSINLDVLIQKTYSRSLKR